ncbi:MAG: hypothetical protein KAR00_03450 [Candidatus Pacebacteria bacterium]|nr:hypothetical protein [Candidatus Paceibacterota bacterium]
MGILNKFFPPKEIKEALEMLEEAEREFSSKDFNLVKGHIEKILRSHPDKFVEIIKQGETPRQQNKVSGTFLPREARQSESAIRIFVKKSSDFIQDTLPIYNFSVSER